MRQGSMLASLAAFWPSLDAGDVAEIALLFVVVYGFLRFVRKTVAGGVLRGLGLLAWVVLLGVFFLLRALQLEVLDYLLVRALPFLLIAVVVVFQPEFRHGLARLGEMRLLQSLLRRRRRGEVRAEEIRSVDEVITAVTAFSKRKTGALVAIERGTDLGQYIDSGVRMDALIRAETLDTIFSTETILHDGAVIVRGDRIAAAGCLLPLTEKPHLARQYGTRHRAAIGLSEQSDAVVVVVSEETGSLHVAERGELQRYTDPAFLSAYLSVVMAEKQGVLATSPAPVPA
jgi:diadenylate cyclase